ncbi:AC1 [Cotton leaf curl Alabad virus]|uniref:Replication-associated protein n=1 Tax=Cotton leaf curl Alabad virus TaxID=222456 RepID=C9W8K2_9GEMI|nr:AC1 [Cotton leaf curl Alabad virus]QCY72137.1 Rep protein [Cotton leaf curl Alabad virus]
MPRNISFCVNAKNIFLTYPKCPIPKEQMLDILRSINCPSDKLFIRVAQEKHQDGSLHIHALIQFKGKAKFRNPRHFDVTHPNTPPNSIQTSRELRPVPMSNPTSRRTMLTSTGVSFRSMEDLLQEVNRQLLLLLQKPYYAGSKEAAMAIIREKLPEKFIFQYHNLNSNLDRIFTPPLEVYVSPFLSSSFNQVPEELEEWVSENVMDAAARPLRPQSIVIEGDSRTGKTMWARSLGPHNYLCGHLDCVPRSTVTTLVYRHCCHRPAFLKHFKEFMGAQRDWQSNTKYGKPVQIKGGIPTIFLCNPGPNSSYKEFLDEEKNTALKNWAVKNAIFITLEGPLYSRTNQSSAQGSEETHQEEESRS